MRTTISDSQGPQPAPIHTRRRPIVLIACALASLAIPASVMADVTVNIVQSGSDVVATETGSLDTSTLSFHASGSNGGPTIIPNVAGVLLGNPSSGTENTWSISNSGPTSWGSGSQTNASSTTGTYFGMTRQFDFLVLSNNYISGSPISGTATWTGETLSGLGLNPGTYVYEAGSVPQTITIEVGQAAAPEPATLWFALIGGAGFVAYGRFARRRNQPRAGLQGPTDSAE
jgi:hypothetical protein